MVALFVDMKKCRMHLLKALNQVRPLLLEKLTQLTQAINLRQTQMMAMHNVALTNPQPTAQPVSITDGSINPNPINIKIDGSNYTLWCQKVEMYVQGRDRMKHLTEVPAPPETTHLGFRKWKVDDVLVKWWLIKIA